MKEKQKMDPRCPRKLADYPNEWCPLAVLRLKQKRNAGKELSEAEESSLSGCEWAINNQSACYCFFKYANDYLVNEQPTDHEIAHMLGVSPNTVKRTAEHAMNRIKESDFIENIKETFGEHGEGMIDPTFLDDDYEVTGLK